MPAAVAAAQFPLPVEATNSSVIKMVYRHGILRAAVREMGTNSLETLRLIVYSCGKGEIISSDIAGTGLMIQSVREIPYQASLINAVKIIDGITNRLAFIFSSSGDFIPQQTFGSLVPRAISQDGLTIVCSVPPDILSSGAGQKSPANTDSKSGYAFDGRRLMSLADYDKSLKAELTDSAWRSARRLAAYLFIAAMVLFVAFSLWKRPLSANPS